MSGTDDERRSLLRSVATLGMAFCGPIAFFTGLWVFATLWAGTPAVLLVVFGSSAAGTVFFTLLYAAVDAKARAGR